MAKKNKFYGAILNQSTVSTYYPVNPTYPNFDHFVFQQMIEDPTDPDDNYTLVAYAANKTGLPILLPPLVASNATPFKAGKKVQFANMKLDLIGLASLYPNGVTSDVELDPTGFYPGTYYIAYTASTVGSGFAVHTYPVDPSPPA